jgi:hypothetical protein
MDGLKRSCEFGLCDCLEASIEWLGERPQIFKISNYPHDYNTRHQIVKAHLIVPSP